MLAIEKEKSPERFHHAINMEGRHQVDDDLGWIMTSLVFKNGGTFSKHIPSMDPSWNVAHNPN